METGRPDRDSARLDPVARVGRVPHPWPRVITIVMEVVLLGLIGLQVVDTDRAGAADADGWHSDELVIADLTANIRDAPDSLLESSLGSGDPVGYPEPWPASPGPSTSACFDSSLAAEDRRRGIAASLLTNVVLPADGTTLSGSAVIDASTSFRGSDTAVQFRASGEHLHDDLVSAHLTPNGWDRDLGHPGSSQRGLSAAERGAPCRDRGGPQQSRRSSGPQPVGQGVRPGCLRTGSGGRHWAAP